MREGKGVSVGGCVGAVVRVADGFKVAVGLGGKAGWRVAVSEGTTVGRIAVSPWTTKGLLSLATTLAGVAVSIELVELHPAKKVIIKTKISNLLVLMIRLHMYIYLPGLCNLH